MKHEETCKHTAVVTNYFGDGYFCTDCDEQLSHKQILKLEVANLTSDQKKRLIIQELQSRFYPELYSKDHIKRLRERFSLIVY